MITAFLEAFAGQVRVRPVPGLPPGASPGLEAFEDQRFHPDLVHACRLWPQRSGTRGLFRRMPRESRTREHPPRAALGPSALPASTQDPRLPDLLARYGWKEGDLAPWRLIDSPRSVRILAADHDAPRGPRYLTHGLDFARNRARVAGVDPRPWRSDPRPARGPAPSRPGLPCLSAPGNHRPKGRGYSEGRDTRSRHPGAPGHLPGHRLAFPGERHLDSRKPIPQGLGPRQHLNRDVFFAHSTTETSLRIRFPIFFLLFHIFIYSKKPRQRQSKKHNKPLTPPSKMPTLCQALRHGAHEVHPHRGF